MLSYQQSKTLLREEWAVQYVSLHRLCPQRCVAKAGRPTGFYVCAVSHHLERADEATANYSLTTAAFKCILCFNLEANLISLLGEQRSRAAQTLCPGMLTGSEEGTQWYQESSLQQLPGFFFSSARENTKICNICVRLPGNRADLSSPNSTARHVRSTVGQITNYFSTTVFDGGSAPLQTLPTKN